jgi:CheY-like chemotaxis protein
VQVVANLLGNAAKYTPEGGRLAVTAFARGDRLHIDVLDNGIGMAPELAARAFDLFTQAERSSDRSSGGLGLGLALVKSLIELHGGEVACASAGAGQGSRFSVCLPLLHAPEAAAPVPDAQPGADAALLRVLVVDDNVDAAVMLAMLLEASGHQVQVEHDPLEALAATLANPPQVCLLDIGLPGIDGLELARRLRARPGTAHALLIAITGYGQDSDRQQILEAGFDHHLVKPIDIAQLYTLLDGVG